MNVLPQFPELPADLRDLLRDLSGGDDVYAYSITPDRTGIKLWLFVDGAPYLQSYELNPTTGEYQILSSIALGRMNL